MKQKEYRLGERQQRMDEIWSAILERKNNPDPVGDLEFESWNTNQIVSWLYDAVNLKVEILRHHAEYYTP